MPHVKSLHPTNQTQYTHHANTMATTVIETSTTANPTKATKQQQSSSGLSPTTRWGCRIPIYPGSLAPKSLDLTHASSSCRCHGREEIIVKDYILRWVSYRIDELKEHPVKATTWARASCEHLGIAGSLDGILDRVERLYAGDGL